jgi:hypothetical protein
MQTKGSPRQHKEERDIELEKIVGNLMIAEYQVDRLRTRLSESIRRSGFGSDPRTNGKASTNVIKHSNRWYKIKKNKKKMMLMVILIPLIFKNITSIVWLV